jgi:hypothetical protein
MMMKTPKHLQNIEPDVLQQMQTGFYRFRFGFAEIGEIHGDQEFLGNFKRKKDAQECKEKNGGGGNNFGRVKINPYLNGKFAVGWAVWKTVAKEPLAGTIAHEVMIV